MSIKPSKPSPAMSEVAGDTPVPSEGSDLSLADVAQPAGLALTCRHADCARVIEVCGCKVYCTFAGWIHTDTGSHLCGMPFTGQTLDCQPEVAQP